MTPSHHALLGYIAWTIAMALVIVVHRGLFLLSGARRIDGFTADNKGLSPMGERLARVHANCVENLPVAGGLLLYALATHRAGITDPLAMPLLGLRMAQSLIHISGARPWQVHLRLACFAGQVTICCVWLIRMWSI